MRLACGLPLTAAAALVLAACGGSPTEAPVSEKSPPAAEIEASPDGAESTAAETMVNAPTSETTAAPVAMPSLEDIAAWGYAGLNQLAAYECDGDVECAAEVSPGILSAPFTKEDMEFFGFASADGATVEPTECTPLLLAQRPAMRSPVETATFRLDRTPDSGDGSGRGVRVLTFVFEWTSAEQAFGEFQKLLAVPDSCGSYTYSEPNVGDDIPESTWLDGVPSRSEDAITWASVERNPLDDNLVLEGVATGQVNNKTYMVTIIDDVAITEENYATKAEELLASLQGAVDWARMAYGASAE